LKTGKKFGEQSLNLFEAALSGENIDKNRYQSVLPPDNSRVILNNDGFGSDYINANFIDGIHSNSKQAYIATQAPKPDTFNDFWRMCWEQNVHIIVMLTNLEEGGRTKAHQYWPKFGTKQFGSWFVTHQSFREAEGYLIRILELYQGINGGGLKPTEDKTNEKRIIYQYHYLIWPDMSVPEDATSLLEMIDDINQTAQKLQSSESQNKPPLLVHCSAGIGRTGTFVLIDTVIKKYREEGVNSIESLDLQPILSTMRDQRPGFVQQKIQYYFCYQSVIQSLTGERISIDDISLKIVPQQDQSLLKSKKRVHSKFKRDQKPAD